MAHCKTGLCLTPSRGGVESVCHLFCLVFLGGGGGGGERLISIIFVHCFGIAAKKSQTGRLLEMSRLEFI